MRGAERRGNLIPAFTGRQFDSETGLYYYRSRYYAPQAGRFTTADPIGLLGGPNLYAYVNNNPTNWIDPWGLKEVKGIDGEIVEVHKYDPDPFPSKPHGHIKGSNKKINVYTGDIYSGGVNVGKLSKKGLVKLQKALKKVGLIGVGIGILADVLGGESFADALVNLLDSSLMGELADDSIPEVDIDVGQIEISTNPGNNKHRPSDLFPENQDAGTGAPEPATMILSGIGVAIVAVYNRRRKWKGIF